MERESLLCERSIKPWNWCVSAHQCTRQSTVCQEEFESAQQEAAAPPGVQLRHQNTLNLQN